MMPRGIYIKNPPRFAIGDRVRIIVTDDVFAGQYATVNGRTRRRSPVRWTYDLHIDARDTTDGPFAEYELEPPAVVCPICGADGFVDQRGLGGHIWGKHHIRMSEMKAETNARL